MPLETLLTFFGACLVLSIIPGPAVLLVVAQAMMRGGKAAALCIFGDLAGGVCLILLSLAGMGAILSASAVLFQIVKWAGVLYLAYLGIRQIAEAHRSSKDGASIPERQETSGSFRAGFLTSLLNPKAIVFYVAFLSQFIDPAGNLVAQSALLIAASCLAAAIVLGGYAILAGRIRTSLSSPRAGKRIGYAGGGFLLGGSVVMAATR